MQIGRPFGEAVWLNGKMENFLLTATSHEENNKVRDF
jgi:hypothetical protein